MYREGERVSIEFMCLFTGRLDVTLQHKMLHNFLANYKWRYGIAFSLPTIINYMWPPKYQFKFCSTDEGLHTLADV